MLIVYGFNIVCKDINLMVEKGDWIVFYGKNGFGKLSIFKLICGEDIVYIG